MYGNKQVLTDYQESDKLLELRSSLYIMAQVFCEFPNVFPKTYLIPSLSNTETNKLKAYCFQEDSRPLLK
jgi:hypothetical protein